MILSNYWKWLMGTETYGTESSEYYDPTQNVGMIDINGNTGYLSFNSSNGDRRSNNRLLSVGQVRFGSGSDDITVTDYQMSNDCTSSIGNVNYNLTISGTDEGIQRTLAITGYNNSGSELTITEAGYCKYVASEQEGEHYVLLIKTKLDTPLVLADGANFLINIAWNEA